LRTCGVAGFDGRILQMPLGERSAEDIRRKLRALTAVFLDPAATEPEKANAEELKLRLENRLKQDAAPQGEAAPQDENWTDIMFRLGRGVKQITSPPPQRGDWTDHAFRLGRMFRKGFKK
jgi:hypothetical protein